MHGPVLIVDDDPDLCALSRQLLETHRCETGVAHSLNGLSEQAAEVGRYRVAFLDIDLGLNQPDGIQVYRWLMNHHYSGKIYFLTGHGKSHPKVLKASEIDAVRVLSKPVSPSRFLRLAFEEES